MPGRRVEERVKSNAATKETGGSQQPSKGRAQGGGKAGTRRAQHRTEKPERGAPEKQEQSGTAHHDRHRTDTTHTAHTHTRTHSTWSTSPGSPPRGRAAGGGGASDPRRSSQRRTATPPGTPYRHPHGAQRRPARARAVGQVQGPHNRTDRTRDTRVAEPWLPAPEDRRPGEGQRLTPDPPHNGGRPPPRGRPLTTPAARSPHRTCRPRGQFWAPTPTHPRPQHGGCGPQEPAQWAGSRERDSA